MRVELQPATTTAAKTGQNILSRARMMAGKASLLKNLRPRIAPGAG
jgi:hypothetical protein